LPSPNSLIVIEVHHQLLRLLANRIGPEVFGFRAKLTGILRSKNSPVMDQTACDWMGLKQGPCDAKSRLLVRRHSGDFGGNARICFCTSDVPRTTVSCCNYAYYRIRVS
jgi:hypothetical protein